MIRRNPSLDLLRGLAIAMVVLTHCSHTAASVIPDLRFFSWHYGKLGVQLFFIVSGYTMMLTFGDNVDATSTRSFYLRRIFRIAPLFWAAILFYLILPAAPDQEVWAPNGIDSSKVALTFFFLHWTSITAFNSVVPGGWSIAVEMQFYALFPLLLYLFRKRNGPILCYTLIAATTIIAKLVADSILEPHLAATLPANQSHLVHAFYYAWLPHQLICFGFGMLLYDYIELKNRPTKGTILLIGACLVSQWTCEVAVLALLAFAVLALNIANPLVGLIGRHSYAIYLVHFAFVWALRTTSLDLGLMFLLVTSLSLCVSYFITEPLIERPLIRLGHDLARRPVNGSTKMLAK